jgi:hypothetical protein
VGTNSPSVGAIAEYQEAKALFNIMILRFFDLARKFLPTPAEQTAEASSRGEEFKCD